MVLVMKSDKPTAPPEKIPKIAFQRKPFNLTKNMTVVQFVIDGMKITSHIHYIN